MMNPKIDDRSVPDRQDFPHPRYARPPASESRGAGNGDFFFFSGLIIGLEGNPSIRAGVRCGL